MFDAIDAYTKSVFSITKLCAQASIALGVFVTIAYCGLIDHYPSGLTLGDSLLFVATSIAFAIHYSLVVGGLLCAGIAISPFMRWIQTAVLRLLIAIPHFKEKEWRLWRINFPALRSEHFIPALFGLLVVWLLALACAAGLQNSGSLVAATVGIAFLWGLWNTKPRRKEYRLVEIRKIKLLLAALIYLAPLAVMEIRGSFLNQTMSMIGVRAESKIVQIDKKHLEFLEQQGIIPSKITKDGHGIYDNVIVQFRGIGLEVAMVIEGFSFSIPSSEATIGGGLEKK